MTATRTYTIEFPSFENDGSLFIVEQSAHSAAAAIFAVAARFGPLKAHSGDYTITEGTQS